jgi:hypothetical protein
MSPLYSPKNRRTFMQRFRDIADGKESWPALHAFIASITPLAEKPKSVDEASRG